MPPLLVIAVGVLVGFFVCLAVAWALIVRALSRRHPELRWDWSTIDPDDVRFPADFVWGTATAAHQVEGGNDNNQWWRWEHSTGADGRPRVQGGHTSGAAVEHWTRFREDIRRMKEELGATSYRFSIEWSRLEPSEGVWDDYAFAHYREVIECCIEHGVEPMITLHHFTDPLWFADKGGFEDQANIDLFVRFARKAFEEYGDKVTRWCTHNEPGPYALMGWLMGVFPPGVKSFERYTRVLCNLVHSHTRVYRALKEMPGGDRAQIALVKNIFQVEPFDRWHVGQWALCRMADVLYNESILRCLKTGVFEVRVPGLINFREEVPGADQSLDVLGLNYYSHILVRLFMRREPPFEVLARPGDVVCDMPYCVYPEGFYRALKRAAEVGKPIVVTENGIPDDRDDRRGDWIRRYAYAMHRAMAEGVDVRGFHYWSLLDNFEWAEGWEPRFGLFGVDYDTQERTLRAGAQPMIDLIRKTGGEPARAESA